MFHGRTIHAITNGVHSASWTAPAMQALFRADVERHVQNMFDQEDPELEPTNYFVPRDRRTGTL